ncbi:MAG: hypothetical protein BGO49_14735 [Planctomycetales bacterium 71-10]|nr:MAG: hypothetical protein BGO49_14735 [Planctomycetales bacterium 71-10]
MAACLTFSRIRMTTRLLRWSMPKIGGLFFLNVPRPGAPFRRRRRPTRFFSTASGWPLCPATKETSSHSTSFESSSGGGRSTIP